MDKNLVVVDNIKKYFKDVKAVDGVSLRINEGEFVALLGPNGAGKTTLVEVIEGIQKQNSGTVVIDGKTWDESPEELHNLIGLSLQETFFFEKLTICETLKLFASFYKLGKERVNEVIKLIRLEEKCDAYVKNLSGGQRQRLALGIAILNKPKLLLLDEPTTGLDPNARREIWDILVDLKKNYNSSLLLTSHYMEEASYLCDRIIVVDNGKMLAEGTLEELLSENKIGSVIEFSVKNDLANADIIKGINENIIWSESKKSWTLQVPEIASYLPNLIKEIEENNLKLTNLESRKLTLDDLFVKLTGRKLND